MWTSKTSLMIILTALFLAPFTSEAQPTLSGNLTGVLTAGTYIVTGNCSVPAGEVLTIEPGTTLLFSGHYFFNVYGQLTANGTETDSIKFLRQNPTEECRHGGIRFQINSSPENSLSYCWIDNAKNQSFPVYIGGAIYIKNAGLVLSHCKITNSKSNTGGGLYAEAATIYIDNCIFDADSAEMGAGIYAEGINQINITYSEFYNNKCINSGYGGGVFFNQCTQATVTNSIFAHNSSAGS